MLGDNTYGLVLMRPRGIKKLTTLASIIEAVSAGRTVSIVAPTEAAANRIWKEVHDTR